MQWAQDRTENDNDLFFATSDYFSFDVFDAVLHIITSVRTWGEIHTARKWQEKPGKKFETGFFKRKWTLDNTVYTHSAQDAAQTNECRQWK